MDFIWDIWFWSRCGQTHEIQSNWLPRFLRNSHPQLTDTLYTHPDLHRHQAPHKLRFASRPDSLLRNGLWPPIVVRIEFNFSALPLSILSSQPPDSTSHDALCYIELTQARSFLCIPCAFPVIHIVPCPVPLALHFADRWHDVHHRVSPVSGIACSKSRTLISSLVHVLFIHSWMTWLTKCGSSYTEET